MDHNRKQPNRKSSPRLKEFDYSQPGFYFVTLSTHNHKPYFGKITDHTVILNDSGVMVKQWWIKLPQKFLMTTLDEFIIMPNHLHGIIQIKSQKTVETGQRLPALLRVCPNGYACPSSSNDSKITGQAHGHVPTLSDILHWYKTMTTNAYIRGVKNQNWPRFDAHLWQRSFYDHIIRDDKDLDHIREYIHNNPSKPHKFVN